MIEVQHLTRFFGSTGAVQDLSLHVSAGEIYGLVGPDGAGKTTTIRLLCGVLASSSGSIRILGNDIVVHPEQARQHIGYLAQRFVLYDELTVMENLRFFAEVRGLKTNEWRPRSLEILEFVGLAPYADRRAGRLSGGMKQKLGLAVALVHRPRVLLLDEPTTGVDPITRQDFWQLIIHLVAHEEVAVLISTPYMDEAARCMRLGFMRAGQLLVEGTPAELRARLRGQVLELHGAYLPALRHIAQADEDVQDVQLFGDKAHILVSKGNSEMVIVRLRKRFLQERLDDFEIKAVDAQLEDVFIALQQVENG
jgi:ABC-2 type transport system ATP-binding protein